MLTTAERHEIEWSCERLVRRYTNAHDRADWRALAGLIAEDAVFSRPSAPDQPIVGKDAILASFRARAPRTARHVIANTVIDAINHDTAKGISLVLLYTATQAGEEAGGFNQPLIGEFRDHFVRSDGDWRFYARSGSIVLTEEEIR